MGPTTNAPPVMSTYRASTPHAPHGEGEPGGAPAIVPWPGVLDAQALERLRELDPTGQNKLLERVFKAIEASIARLMPQLDAAGAGEDWQTVRQVAHTLKSSSASIGAIKLSGLCADIESMVRQAQVQGLHERLDAMRAEVANVLAALRGLQGERG